jgi:hypothetical protein
MHHPVPVKRTVYFNLQNSSSNISITVLSLFHLSKDTLTSQMCCSVWMWWHNPRVMNATDCQSTNCTDLVEIYFDVLNKWISIHVFKFLIHRPTTLLNMKLLKNSAKNYQINTSKYSDSKQWKLIEYPVL